MLKISYFKLNEWYRSPWFCLALSASSRRLSLVDALNDWFHRLPVDKNGGFKESVKIWVTESPSKDSLTVVRSFCTRYRLTVLLNLYFLSSFSASLCSLSLAVSEKSPTEYCSSIAIWYWSWFLFYRASEYQSEPKEKQQCKGSNHYPFRGHVITLN